MPILFAALTAVYNERRTMSEVGRVLIVLGGVLMLGGLILLLAGKLHVPMGRLPGDIVYRGKNTTFYFPLVSSILLSALLTVVLYVIGKWRR